MGLKYYLKRILGLHEYDREGERLILKSVQLYHKVGTINRWRAYRLHNSIRKNYCCCVYPKVTIGKNFYIAHAHNITIGRSAVIGDNCKIYPYCYIMASLKGDDERTRNGERRHAKIGNDCILGAKSTIIGPITIGDDVTIGAGAIITKDVPSHTVVKGINGFRPKRPEEMPEKYKSGENI